MLCETVQTGVDKDVISQRMNKPQSTKPFLFLSSSDPGSPLCLLCDRLTDFCAVWDAGVLLVSAAGKGAPSGVTGRRLNESETVSAWLPGSGAGWGQFLPPAPSL